jgi:Reverse transcriptase (RNA-dependent DNA polymerase)
LSHSCLHLTILAVSNRPIAKATLPNLHCCVPLRAYTLQSTTRNSLSSWVFISAAFCDAILLERLHSVFGVEGTALNWLSSYLSDRKQYVQLGRHRSSTIPCFSGVPQGSGLGALLFIAYVSPVGDVITRYGLNYHQYADDTHVILAASAATIHSDLSAVEICSSAVKLWFVQNHLLLNADKSEFMFIGTSAQLCAVAIESVKVAGAKLPVSTKIKSLGVIIDTPPYLLSLLIDHSVHTSTSLCSSDRPLLAVNRTRTDYGRRSFSVAAATVWNNLPAYLQSSSFITCRRHLKTFLCSNTCGH